MVSLKDERNVLDAEKSIVLGDTLAARRSTRLNLADAQGDDQIGDKGVLSFTRSVRDHDAPSVALSELSTVEAYVQEYSACLQKHSKLSTSLRLNGLGNSADLVNLSRVLRRG